MEPILVQEQVFKLMKEKEEDMSHGLIATAPPLPYQTADIAISVATFRLGLTGRYLFSPWLQSSSTAFVAPVASPLHSGRD